MRDNLDDAHMVMLRFEGKWSDHPADPGGATMYGVTLKVYQQWCAKHGLPQPGKAELRGMPMEHVHAIFKVGYWDTVRGDDLPPGIDLVTVDMSYNSGPGNALTTLRHACGLAPHKGGLTDDEIGHIWGIPDWDGVVNAFNDARLHFMQTCKGGTLWPTFGKGWSNRVAGIRSAALHMAPDQPATYIAALHAGGDHHTALADASIKSGKAVEHDDDHHTA